MRHHLIILSLIVALGFSISACDGSSSSELRHELEDVRQEIRELRQLRFEMENLGQEVRRLRDMEGTESTSLDESAPITSASFSLNGSERDDPFLGDKQAPLLLMAFIDYQSEQCKKFASETLAKLREEYVDTRQLRILLRDFPLANHPHAVDAAKFAHCAGESGQYWMAHDKLWGLISPFGESELTRLAGEFSGDNTGKFDRCRNGQLYEKEIRKDIEDGQRLGARGAPSFLLARKVGDSYQGVLIRGAQPFSVFVAEIRKLSTPASSN